MTSYVVLYKPEAPTAGTAGGTSATTGHPRGWEKLSKEYAAISNVAAVRAAAADTQKVGSYVAIPSRSFDIVRIEIETNPRVKVVKPS